MSNLTTIRDQIMANANFIFPNHPNLSILVISTSAKPGYLANVVTNDRDNINMAAHQGRASLHHSDFTVIEGEHGKDLERTYLNLLRSSAQEVDAWSYVL